MTHQQFLEFTKGCLYVYPIRYVVGYDGSMWAWKGMGLHKLESITKGLW